MEQELPKKTSELVERILSASLGDLHDIVVQLDVTACPDIVLISFWYRYYCLCEEIDRLTIDRIRKHIDENEYRAVRVSDDFWKIP